MAGKSGKKTQPQSKALDDFDDDVEDFDEEVPNLDNGRDAAVVIRTRDWRDVEKYREMRELRKLVGDDFDDVIAAPSPSVPPARPKPRRQKPSAGTATVKRHRGAKAAPRSTRSRSPERRKTKRK